MTHRQAIESIYQKCRNRVILATPDKNSESIWRDIHYSRLCDLGGWAAPISGGAMGGAPTTPECGYSINHSTLTAGVLWMMNVRNLRSNINVSGEVNLYTGDNQWDFLLDDLWTRGYTNELADAIMLTHTKHGRTPFEFLRMKIHAGDTLPRYRIAERGDGYGFDEVKPDDSGYAEAPYQASILDHPAPECSWFIIHRIPFPREQPWLLRAQPIGISSRVTLFS